MNKKYIFQFSNEDKKHYKNQKTHTSIYGNNSSNSRASDMVSVLKKPIHDVVSILKDSVMSSKELDNSENFVELKPNTILSSRYEIISKMQEKQNTVIYTARCRLLDRKVLIEVLKGKYTENDAKYRIFKSSAIKSAELSHYHILTTYDVGCDSGTAYVVKEYFEGQTLDSYLKSTTMMSVDRATLISMRLRDALKYAYEKGVIHTDLCPENIFINSDGLIKLNFNYVSAKAEEKENYHYISPEQARCGYVDYQSDMYSLGCIMFRLYIGRTPFKDDTFIKVAMDHLQTKPGSPKLVNGTIPANISKMIQKCLEKNPRDRYSSYDEMLF